MNESLRNSDVNCSVFVIRPVFRCSVETPFEFGAHARESKLNQFDLQLVMSVATRRRVLACQCVTEQVQMKEQEEVLQSVNPPRGRGIDGKSQRMADQQKDQTP